MSLSKTDQIAGCQADSKDHHADEAPQARDHTGEVTSKPQPCRLLMVRDCAQRKVMSIRQFFERIRQS